MAIDYITLTVDDGTPKPMPLDGNAVTATLATSAIDGEHRITIQVCQKMAQNSSKLG